MSKKKPAKKSTKKKTTKKKTETEVMRRYRERVRKVISVAQPSQVAAHIPEGHKLSSAVGLGTLKGKIWLEISTLPIR